MYFIGFPLSPSISVPVRVLRVNDAHYPLDFRLINRVNLVFRPEVLAQSTRLFPLLAETAASCPKQEPLKLKNFPNPKNHPELLAGPVAVRGVPSA